MATSGGSAEPVLTHARRAGFGPLTIAYDGRVLEPRPWTLLQSDWAAELSPLLPAGPLLELCAGAGQIGLAAAVASNRALVQVDADPVAAGYAEANARAAWVAADVRCGRLDEALADGERFWLAVADPPYLPTVEVDEWPDDPVIAIDGGDDGLAVTRLAIGVLAAHLHPGGVALLQVAGPLQAAAVAGEVTGAGVPLTVGEVRVVDDRRAVMALHRRAA